MGINRFLQFPVGRLQLQRYFCRHGSLSPDDGDIFPESESPNKCISLPVFSAPQSLARRTFGAHIAAWRNFADCWKNICPPSDAVDKSGYNCTCGGPLKNSFSEMCAKRSENFPPRCFSVWDFPVTSIYVQSSSCPLTWPGSERLQNSRR